MKMLLWQNKTVLIIDPLQPSFEFRDQEPLSDNLNESMYKALQIIRHTVGKEKEINE